METIENGTLFLKMKALIDEMSYIPTGDIENDIKSIETFLSYFHKFKEPFEAVKKLNLNEIPSEKLLEIVGELSTSATKPSQLQQLYNHLTASLSKPDLYFLFTQSHCYYDFLLPKIMKSSDEYSTILESLEKLPYLQQQHRQIRQSLFRFAALRKEIDVCQNIIESVNVAKSSNDFLDFCSYSTSFIPLISHDQNISKSFFEYIINMAAALSDAKRDWLINFAASFASLVKMKSLHPAILDFVTFQKRPISTINRFKNATMGLFDPKLPLNSAPALVRPYALHNRWHIEPETLDKAETAEDMHNILLRLCKEDPGKAVTFLRQLPTTVSLPLYAVCRETHPTEFHAAVERAFNSGNEELAIAVLEREGRSSPAVIKPHYSAISKLGFVRCQTLVALLIRAEVLDFERLWQHVSGRPFKEIPALVREGLVQVQKRPRTNARASFIVGVLRTLFPGSGGGIAWGTVAESFPGDREIAALMLLGEGDREEKAAALPLLKWRAGFLQWVPKSPATLRSAAIVPYLLTLSCETQIDVEAVKWAAQNIPSGRCTADSVVEAYAIFEVARSILKQNQSQESAIGILKEAFGVSMKSIVSYSSIFAHAAIALDLGIGASMDLIKAALNAPSTIIRSGAAIAIKLLETHKMVNIDNLAASIDLPIVGRIVEFLSPSSESIVVKTPPNWKPTNSEDADVIENLKKTHEMVTAQESIDVNVSSFKCVSEIKRHLLHLAVGCFLFLPSRAVQKNSVERIISLVKSPSSKPVQREFGLLALSMMPDAPMDGFAELLQSDKQLAKTMLCVAVRVNSVEFITKILQLSDDFNIIFGLKPIIAFFDKSIVSNFLEKTTPMATTDDLLASVDMFASFQHIEIILRNLRKRDIYDSFINGHAERLASVLLRAASQETNEPAAKAIEDIVTATDDFGLICACLSNASVSQIVWRVADFDFSLKIFFEVCMHVRGKLGSLIESIFAILQHSYDQQSDRLLLALGVALIARSDSAPISTIRERVEANPNQLTEALVLSILPSAISLSKAIRSEQIDVFSNISLVKYAEVRSEITSTISIVKI